MATIDKMMIQGIRAFRTEKGESIKFEPPLTIVAGVNGSGKTTIIECLRYATTGSLPPGAQLKGAWIHDPGLDGQRNVMAQVKLGFHAANGTRLVAARSLELNNKNGARSQKTLECSLLMERHGQKTTLSTRVAELDQQIPLYLGVTPSLLDNVLFCHQEDSQWPLAESSILKKKFDEIFEAGKYTKAVKELVDIRKKHRLDLGRQEALAETAKKDRDRSKKVEKQCQKLKSDIDALRDQANDLKAKMENARHQADESWKKAESFAGDLGRLEEHRQAANHAEYSINELKTHLKEISESDEWIRKTLADFDNTLARYEDDKRTKERQLAEYIEELKATNQRLSTKQSDKGRYEQAKAENERQLEDRKLQIKEAAAQHKLRGFDDLSEDSKVEEFLYKFKKLAKDRVSARDRARGEADDEKQQARTSINTLHARRDVLKHSKTEARNEIERCAREAARKQNEANKIPADEGSKATIDTRIEESTARLRQLHGVAREGDYAVKLQQAKAEQMLIESEVARLQTELGESTKYATELACLAQLKKTIKEKGSALSTLTQAHGSRITNIVADEWKPDTLERQYKSVSEDAQKALEIAERERDGVVRESEQNRFKQSSIRDEVEKKKRDAKQHENEVVRLIESDISEYDEILTSVTFRVETARDQLKGRGGLADYFEKLLDTAKKHKACRLCDRGFKSADDPYLLKFQQKLEKLIKQASSADAEAELQDATEQYKHVMDAGVHHENWKRLTETEIPPLEQQLSRLEKEYEKLLTQTEGHDGKVDSKQTAQKEIESISSIVKSIVKNEQDLRSYHTEVQQLSTEQSQTVSNRTSDDILEDIRRANIKVSEIKRTIEQLDSEQRSSQSEIYQLEIDIGKLRTQLESINRHLGEKQSLLNRVEEYNNKKQEQRDKIASIDADLEKIGPEIATAEAKYEDLKDRWAVKLRELEAESSALSETNDQLRRISSALQGYIDRDEAGKLDVTIRDISRLGKETSRLESVMQQVNKEIEGVKQHLADSEHTRRHYSDNLRYREESRQLKWLRGQIEELESKNMEFDRDQLAEQGERMRAQYHNFSAQREGIVGEMKTKDSQLEELLLEFKTDLKDAAARYKEAHIKYESTKAAIEDIGKYSTALDKAVTKYHAVKMDQVNAIMDELWKKTYQGTDVDTIYIKSDLEVKANTRTHNYRVVMLKRDIELDMRGRCSAGQKVLASIIIRLALAECFSRDCGVIALDEPTTNLDERNIEALAQALHAIVEARKSQPNFQMIVITHDEKFLQLMRCSDFTDNYWMVSRNPKDESIIRQQSILEIVR